MEIKRSGSQPSGKGPAEYFTGTVRIDPLFERPIRHACAAQRHVRARRAHRMAHPPAGPDADRDGGCGWAQRWGGPVEEIRPGDVVWIPPGEKHWHGATRHHGDDAHRHSGTARRQGRRLDGKGQRRTIPGRIGCQGANMNAKQLLTLGASALASSVSGLALAEEMQGQYVQVAEIEIDPAQLESYKAAVKEQIETAIGVEPGRSGLVRRFCERQSRPHQGL